MNAGPVAACIVVVAMTAGALTESLAVGLLTLFGLVLVDFWIESCQRGAR